MKSKVDVNVGLGMFLFVILVMIFSAVGYIGNIVRLAHTDFKPSYKAEILRGVGIVIPPVGIIEGYIKIAD